jgi:hypothetical protein
MWNDSPPHHSYHVHALLSCKEFPRISPCCVNLLALVVTPSSLKGPQALNEGQSGHLNMQIKNWIMPMDFSLKIKDFEQD